MHQACFTGTRMIYMLNLMIILALKNIQKMEKTIELRVNFEEILNELSIIFTLKYVIYSQNYAAGSIERNSNLNKIIQSKKLGM
jgi:hypothetical protein